jgi:hypothetical protein
MILFAAVMIMAAVDLGESRMPIPPVYAPNGIPRIHRRRPLEPRPAAVVEFSEQCAILGLIAIGGRKILRLRL